MGKQVKKEDKMSVEDQVGSRPAGLVCAVIPARGGSKRVRGKNLIPINGRPLIAYTIEAARLSGVFSRVIVNSESNQILATATKYGAEIYRRPANLSSDRSYVIEVLQEMIASSRFPDETVIGILLPTCALRSVEDIVEGYRIFRSQGSTAPVVSVTRYEHPIQLALRITNDRRLEPIFQDDYGRSTRTQDHSESYRANYGIIFNTAGNLRVQKNLIGQRPIPYVMPPERSIDIDEPFQVRLVEALLNFRG